MQDWSPKILQLLQQQNCDLTWLTIIYILYCFVKKQITWYDNGDINEAQEIHKYNTLVLKILCYSTYTGTIYLEIK